jgi:hypothetical protein
MSTFEDAERSLDALFKRVAKRIVETEQAIDQLYVDDPVGRQAADDRFQTTQTIMAEEARHVIGTIHNHPDLPWLEPTNYKNHVLVAALAEMIIISTPDAATAELQSFTSPRSTAPKPFAPRRAPSKPSATQPRPRPAFANTAANRSIASDCIATTPVTPP